MSGRDGRRRGPHQKDKKFDKGVKDFNRQVGRRVRALRLAADITQEELSAVLDYSGTSMVSQIESGAKIMSPEKALALANFFNVSLDLLYSGEEKSKEDLQATMALGKLQSLPTDKRPDYGAILKLLGVK